MHIYFLTYVLYFRYFKGSLLTVGFLMTFSQRSLVLFYSPSPVYIYIPSPPSLEFLYFPNVLIKSLVTCYSRFYCSPTPYSSYPRIFFFNFSCFCTYSRIGITFEEEDLGVSDERELVIIFLYGSRFVQYDLYGYD